MGTHPIFESDFDCLTEIEREVMDPCSFTNSDVFRTKSIHFEWDIDFDKKQIAGVVSLSCDIAKSTTEVILDTRELSVQSVSVGGQNCAFKIGDRGSKCEALGKPLIITFANALEGAVTIDIRYNTTEKCSALQWLTKEQTCGGNHPYLFSQCQAIHARSLFPCQDSPGIKVKYTAVVNVAAPLVALMSANLLHDKTVRGATRNSFHFSQHVPMSTYLVAIAAGALESREIGPRSRVWSEVEMVDKAAFEFAETEDFIKTGEALLGDYVWGQYDLLVLPPSFPYGGMENPCLTFVTPTLLAGDRSLAGVVAHEIAHSWTGNLVTNSTWEHFWLNEGHTVFVERKIIGRMFGTKEEHFHAIGGWTALKETVDVLGPDNAYTHLVIKNDGTVDPDDSFSRIPYEKGFSLLWYLQSLLGIEKFEGFLKAYIKEFSYKSLTTSDWKDFLYSFFKAEKTPLDTVDWESWFNKPGIAPVKGQYDTSLQDACTELSNKWIKGAVGDASSDDIKEFSAGQLQGFLDQLVMADPLPIAAVAEMDAKYPRISNSNNSEVRFRWLRVCIKAKYEKCLDNALAMVTEQGRMKFTRPLYRDLNNWDFARTKAIETFKKNRPSMHNTTASLVAKDLNLHVSKF